MSILFPDMLPPKETCKTCRHEFGVCVCNNTRAVYVHYCKRKPIGDTYHRIRLKDVACGFWERKEQDTITNK